MNETLNRLSDVRPTPLSKRVFDLCVASIGLLALALLFPIIAVLIIVDSRGPVIYRQERIGRGGKSFTMYKFRTMARNAEALLSTLAYRNLGGDYLIRIPHDPRITRVGRWLRRTGLDEMPQFINILKGDMSLIGPRPQAPNEVALYTAKQRRRLEVLPGITGLWQVTARTDPSFDEWVRNDLKYIESWSIWLDFSILLRTPLSMFGSHPADQMAEESIRDARLRNWLDVHEEDFGVFADKFRLRGVR